MNQRETGSQQRNIIHNSSLEWGLVSTNSLRCKPHCPSLNYSSVTIFDTAFTLDETLNAGEITGICNLSCFSKIPLVSPVIRQLQREQRLNPYWATFNYLSLDQSLMLSLCFRASDAAPNKKINKDKNAASSLRTRGQSTAALLLFTRQLLKTWPLHESSQGLVS